MKLKLKNIGVVLMVAGLGISVYIPQYYERKFNFPFNIRDFKFAHYLPGVGTIDMTDGLPPIRRVHLVGKPLEVPIFVASDFGHNVVAVNQAGEVDWMELESYYPFSAAYSKNRLYIPGKKEILVLDPLTGRTLQTFKGLKEIVLGIQVRKNHMVVTYNKTGEGSVEIFRLETAEDGKEELELVFQNPQPAVYPRFADFVNGVLYVADTFGHRVYGVQIKSGEILFEKKEIYFPNDIKVLSPENIIIAEEHANRITRWNPVTGEYVVLFSCPDPDYSNASLILKDLMRWEKSKIKNGIGLCSERNSGINTLYSPNGVVPVDENGFFVADTDNHRVIFIREGKVESILTGFNNPVKVELFRD